MDEHKFIADVERMVDGLVKKLYDSPKSLRGHLNYWLGRLDGTCDAKPWNSVDIQRLRAKISTTIETLPW